MLRNNRKYEHVLAVDYKSLYIKSWRKSKDWFQCIVCSCCRFHIDLSLFISIGSKLSVLSFYFSRQKAFATCWWRLLMFLLKAISCQYWMWLCWLMPAILWLMKPSRAGPAVLAHWGWVKHICVGKLTIIGSDNGLSPGRCQAIIWTNDWILLIGPLGTYFSAISFKKMHLKMSSGKWRPFCLGLNVFKYAWSTLRLKMSQQLTALCHQQTYSLCWI